AERKRAGGEIVIAADDAGAGSRRAWRQVNDGAAGAQVGEADLAPVPAVVVEPPAERRRRPAHPLVEDRAVLLHVAALGTRRQRILTRLRRNLVALLGEGGERPADLLVGSFQDEVTHFQRILVAAGDHLILVNDLGNDFGRRSRLSGQWRDE